MRQRRSHPALRLLPLACALTAAGAAADSGGGVDTWRANQLDPAAGATQAGCDERGTSWLRAHPHRTPTGMPYACPPAVAATDEEARDPWAWRHAGVLQLGWLETGGDDDNASWTRYVDWDSGLVLGLLQGSFERPADGSHAEVRASRLGDDDAYYQAVFGRAGSYKVQAFIRSLPNMLTHNAKPLWDGVGSNQLTLPAGLVPGGSTPEEVAAVVAATPERRLAVTRDKQGLGVSAWLTPQWSAYADLSHEQRKGARPFGGTFFFNFPFPGNGGVFETPRPIDDATINLNAGLRYVGAVWRLDLGYSGSWYRDHDSRFTFETPYALYPVVPGAVSAPLTTGQFATEPDNDYHNLKAALTRKLPMEGELSLTASGGRMSQDDALIAPIDCQGVFGIGLDGSLQPGPQNPFLHECANWNTPAALSRRTADLAIDTTLLDARLVLQPWAGWTLRGDVRYDREDYSGSYLAFNPLTGQYGYVTENGAQGSVVPGEIGFWDAGFNASNITRVRSLPLDLETTEASVGADWRATVHDTFGATLSFNRFEPTNRERRRVDATRLKLTWVNRALDWLTLRANATLASQDGDRYEVDPYEFTFSTSLPGFVPPPGGVPAHTVDAMRKYDLASREQRKVDLMATVMPRADMTFTASLRGDWNDYDAEIGRQRYDTLGAVVQWEWQPMAGTSASVYYGYDRSRLHMANVNEAVTNNPDPTLGGPTYPLEGRWWADDEQRNHNAGATLRHGIGRVRLDADWNLIDARGITRYRYDTPLALAYFGDATAVPGNVFPPMRWRVNALTVGVTVPMGPRVSLRLFDRYERGDISDWHYQGFDATRVIDHRVYTDGGPESFDANLVGLLLDIRL